MPRPQAQIPRTFSTPNATRSHNDLPMDEAMRERIARRAYELFTSRGRVHGHELEDWFQAERELRLGRN